MKVYRIARARYIDDLSGMGARIYRGRWNHKGTSILYTSENRALATVEYLVHLSFPLVPDDLSLITLHIPDKIIPQKISTSEFTG